MVRFLALLQAVLLFFSGSPAVMAMQFSAGMRSSGSGSQAGGGQGSAANLQNAGAASAALTAALAKASLQKSQAVINGLTTAQTQAADAAKGDPNNGTLNPGTPNAKTVVNGLQITAPTGANEAPGLVPYYNAPAPTGPNIPNGPVAVPGTWSGVQSVSQAATGPAGATAPSSATVTITQNQQSAYLYWSHFNVGAQTTVNFNQSGNNGSPGSWIAFNKVMTASDPSHIFGTIKAPGQVYILNQGGILFHAGSTVNVQSLVASALPINPKLAGDPLNSITSQGLVNLSAKKPEFLFDIANGTGSGNVSVEKGAQIFSFSRNGSGGKVALIGKNVQNDGVISTPDGQSIIAAGNQVAFTPHASSDPTLRGMDVFVGNSDNAGNVLNSGLIDAPRASVILAGKTITQSGFIDSSTSVAVNGRVDLVARSGAIYNSNYDPTSLSAPFLYNQKPNGSILQSGVICILPEWSSGDAAPGLALSLPSIMTAQAGTIEISGSILAPGARVPTGLGAVLPSAVNLGQLTEGITLNALNGITLNAGAGIYAAGSTGVSAPMSENFLTIQLRGGELADSPLQQNNFTIRGKSITIDARLSGVYNGIQWIGTPLGDATGFLNLINRSVGELTVAGGTISMTSDNNQVSIASGATVDVSGGWLQYSGGYFATTSLITQQGIGIDISKATPDQVYTGILKNTPPVYQPGYFVGGDAGYINISAPSTPLNGTLNGRSIAGSYQLRTPASGFTQSAMPMPGSLLLNTSDRSISFSANDAGAGFKANGSLVISADLLQSHGFGNLTILDYEANIIVPSGVTLNAPLIGSVQVNGVARPGSSVFLSGANITVDGAITVPGGLLSLNAFTVSPAADAANSLAARPNLPVPLAPTLDGTLIVHPGAILSTAGLVTYDSGSVWPSQPVVIDGGSETDPSSGQHLAGINLSSFRADLTGSIIDVSGGAYVKIGKVPVYGNAGFLSITTGMDPQNGYSNPVPYMNVNLSTPSSIQVNTPDGGFLHLGSIMRGYSGNSVSGSLLLSAPMIQVGGITQNADTLLLSPEFFSQGGFGQFSLIGIGEQGGSRGVFLPAISLAPGAIISPAVTSQILLQTPSGYQLAPLALGAGYRNPASISLSAIGYTDSEDQLSGYNRFIRGDIVIGQNASIITDPWNSSLMQALGPASSPGSFSTISLNSQNTSMFGSLISPGGNISITTSSQSIDSYPIDLYNVTSGPRVTLDLDGGIISSAGSNLALQNSSLQHLLPYLNGGSVSLKGNIAVRGTLLDVSGSSGLADVIPYLVTGGVQSSHGSRYQVVESDGNGGTLTLKGGELLLAGGTLKGFAGGPSAQGGGLNISSGLYVEPGADANLNYNLNTGLPISEGLVAPNIMVSMIGSDFTGFSATIGQAVRHGNKYLQAGHFGISTYSDSGFDALTLGGSVDFQGKVDIQAKQRISVGAAGMIFGNDQVNLTAPYVVLGTPYQAPVSTDPSDQNGLNSDPSLSHVFSHNGLPFYAPPISGNGSLNVFADLIDVGNLSLQGMKSLDFEVPQGAIRGYGSLDIAGKMTLHAGEIYPPTDMSFNLVAFNHDVSGRAVTAIGGGISLGSIEIKKGDLLALPFSAGGTLNLFADTITQGGVLAAPFGKIVLGSDGSPSLLQADGVSLKQADPLAGMNVPSTTTLTLSDGSITTVSGIDQNTGASITVPYGHSTDGKNWIDPTGRDISGGNGIPVSSIILQAKDAVLTSATSSVDLQGGGQLLAYQWVSGNSGSRDLLGGTSSLWNSSSTYAAGDEVIWAGQTWSARSRNLDQAPPSSANSANLFWSLVPQSFAIIPGYTFGYAPLAAYNKLGGQNPYTLANSSLGANIGYDPGYTGSMQVGDVIHLNASSALQSGDYTLLPARYAILSGAVLLIQNLSSQIKSGILPDGSTGVVGARYNDLNPGINQPPAGKNYILFAGNSLKNLSQDNLFSSSTLGPDLTRGLANSDSGYLRVEAGKTMSLKGQITGKSSATSARGAIIDIAAAGDIAIVGKNEHSSDSVVLQSLMIDQWQASSLLIGGFRSDPFASFSVLTVKTPNISVNNGSSPLTLSDIILAADQSVSLLQGAVITASGSQVAPDEDLQLGVSGDLTQKGNGALLRVSSDKNVTVTRQNVDSQPVQQTLVDGAGKSLTPNLIIGEYVSLAGQSLILDSSSSESIKSSAQLNSSAVTINAGSISMIINPALTQANLHVSDANSLVLSGVTLAGIQSCKSLSLTSYSTLDLYGAGSFGSSALSLSLHTGELRGFALQGGDLSVTASSITLDNTGNVSSQGPVTTSSNGSLTMNAPTISLGAHTMRIDQFASVFLNASGEFFGTATGGLSVGSTTMPTDLSITTPLVTGTAASSTTLASSGKLTLQAPDPQHTTVTPIASGLGADLNLQGASISINTKIWLPSGSITAEATTGDVTLGGNGVGKLDVGGASRSFFDVTKYSDAGTISVVSLLGNILIQPRAVINLSAQSGGGSAGSFSINAPNGALLGLLENINSISVSALAPMGAFGSFTADLKSLASLTTLGADLSLFEGLLTSAGFTQSQNIRDRTDSQISVGNVKAHSYTLSADAGSIAVNGIIDASGVALNGDGILRGGAISLFAGQNIVVNSGSLLTVHGQEFDNAGKGGAIDLEAGNNSSLAASSTVDLQMLSVLDLGVDHTAGLGQDSGTLHLRAPQTGNFLDVQLTPISAKILGASAINIEGFHLQDAAKVGSASIDIYENNALNNAQTFGGNYVTILDRVLGTQAASNGNYRLISLLSPGEEIVNSLGGLVLNNPLDLSLARYGPNINVLDQNGNDTGITTGRNAGFLTLRAKGDVTFLGSLSDGFGDSVSNALKYTDLNGNQGLWLATLLPLVSSPSKINPDGSVDIPNRLSQLSWSYLITAGMDPMAANPSATGVTAGSVVVGHVANDNGQLPSLNNFSQNQQYLVSNYTTLRTGTGNITISASNDIVLKSELSTLYTAGALVQDPNLGGAFTTPVRWGDMYDPNFGNSVYLYQPQFSAGGGNVSLSAQGSIYHSTIPGNIFVSQLPNNWLQRYSDGVSLSEWVDFSIFYQGIGALGSGNVTLNARRGIADLDAVIPSNYRNPIYQSASTGVNLGGGDLTVSSGGNILSGVYYVENGSGLIEAKGQIKADSSAKNLDPRNVLYADLTSLPTTLFGGRSQFTVLAGSEVTLGPEANPNLLPMGLPVLPNGSMSFDQWNSLYGSTIPYFSSYNSGTSLSVSSLSGNVIMRETTHLGSDNQNMPFLTDWLNVQYAKNYYDRPWLQLVNDTHQSLGPLSGAALLPPSVSVTSFEGSINLVAGRFNDGAWTQLTGEVSLAPSSTGNLQILSAQAINGLQSGGVSADGRPFYAYAALNLSDALPTRIYSGGAPIPIDDNFANALADSGSTAGAYAIFQAQSVLHSPDLHNHDPNPLRLYAANGDVSGLGLISPKASRIMAEESITDVSFYIQNVLSSDISAVTAGKDIILNDANSLLRSGALLNGASLAPAYALAGDIQISGPGTLEVTAGQSINLGSAAPGYSDSFVYKDATLGRGIVSIGNARNPYISSVGADIIMVAGVNAPSELSSFGNGFAKLLTTLLTSNNESRYLSDLNRFEILQGNTELWSAKSLMDSVDISLRDRVALELFYIALRDAGRDHNEQGSNGYGNYDAGEAAIKALFGGRTGAGDIVTSSRDIRSSQGGNISLLVPNGALTLQTTLLRDSNPGLAAPPPGMVTELGGSIAIYTQESVNLGISRIFTLNGGNIMIWSDKGNVAAGSSKKTVLSAPPTTVAVDPQSGNVKANLGGLATGGGIGVLKAYANAPVGDVDLIAVSGVIDAGDAGIVSSGNLHLAATAILNADNIKVGGLSVGVPPLATSSAPAAAPVAAAPPAAAPSSAASTAAAAASSAADKTADTSTANQDDATPSVFSIDIMGYGGGEGDDDDSQKKAADTAVAPVQASL